MAARVGYKGQYTGLLLNMVPYIVKRKQTTRLQLDTLSYYSKLDHREHIQKVDDIQFLHSIDSTSNIQWIPETQEIQEISAKAEG